MQTDSTRGTKILRPQLDTFIQSCMVNGDTWRNSGFLPPPGGGEFGAGVLNMSPGWFQQSHEVSHFILLNILWFVCLSSLCLEKLNKKIYVSSDVRSDDAADFLRATANVDLIANAITALIAPQQYDVGLAAIQLLKDGMHLHKTHPNLECWTSVWSGFAMIVNRKTYIHHDVRAALMDYDLLFSSGTHKQCMLDVRDLGLRLLYPPGTGVAITGKVLRHGVETWDGGERICQAWFMKDAVHDHLGQQRPDWVCHKNYLDLLT